MKTTNITPMINDKMFFHIMHSNKDYLINLISYITNIPPKILNNIKYLDTLLIEDNEKNKHQRSDIIVEVDNYTINLEMNAKYYKELMTKNNSYLYSLHNQDNMEGKKYDIDKVFIQINFDNFKRYGKRIVNEYILKEKKDNTEYPIKRIKIYHIELDYLQNIKYTKSEKTKLIKYLKVMISKDKEELRRISKGDKILEGVVEEMIRYTKEIPYGYRDVGLEEEYLTNTFRDKWEKVGLNKGIQQGVQQRNQEVNINMMNKGYTLEEISSITNIPIEELETKKHKYIEEINK